MVLTPEGYRKRILDPTIEDYLEVFGAVSIMGPKWCGKTWTARSHANSEFRVMDSNGPITNRDLVRSDIRVATTGNAPHLIDEWQEVPEIWDRVRYEVDESGTKGRFILTGSSVPCRESYMHSGAGRIGTVHMTTMTLYEMGVSKRLASLGDVLEGNIPMTDCGTTTLESLVDIMIRGGWPGQMGLPVKKSNLLASGYLELALEDACSLDGKRRDVKKMAMLLKSLARNESTLVSDATLKRDMMKFDDENIALETLYEYLDCLQRINLVYETPAFMPNARSNVRVGKMPKRHLVDTSLSISALNLTKDSLMADLNTLGLFFEALCEHDLKVYAEANGGTLCHYHDHHGREADAVIDMGDGRWCAIEIKLSASAVDDGAKNLLKLKKVYEEKGNPPCALCVVSGLGRYAYTRPDGVVVVPFTSLCP